MTDLGVFEAIHIARALRRLKPLVAAVAGRLNFQVTHRASRR
jgi:hypothetical protein